MKKIILIGMIISLLSCKDNKEEAAQLPDEKCTKTSERQEDAFLHQAIISYLQDHGCVVFANPEYMKGKVLPSGDIQYVVLRKDGAAIISEAAEIDPYNAKDTPYMSESLEFFSWQEVGKIMCGQEIKDNIPLPFFRDQGDYWLASMRSIPNAGCEPGCRVAESFRIYKTDPQCVPLKMIDPNVLDVIQKIGTLVNKECNQLRKEPVIEENPNLLDTLDRKDFEF